MSTADVSNMGSSIVFCTERNPSLMASCISNKLSIIPGSCRDQLVVLRDVAEEFKARHSEVGQHGQHMAAILHLTNVMIVCSLAQVMHKDIDCNALLL
eukprot:578384-Amphidinium_carterae.2